MYGKLLTTAVAVMATNAALAQQIPTQPQPVPNQTQRDQRNAAENQREIDRAHQDLKNAQREAEQIINRDQPATARTTAGQSQSLDQKIADCLILGNQEEIELCRFAVQHIQSDEVKQAAEKMIADHEQFVQKLRKFATHMQNHDANLDRRGAAIDQPNQPVAPNDRRGALQNSQRSPITGETRTTERTTVTAGYGPNPDQMYQVEKEASQHCLRLTKEALEKEQGEKFDKAFIGQQCGAHIGMLAKLMAAENHVSPEFKSVVQEGIQTTKQHKQQLEQLRDNLRK